MKNFDANACLNAFCALCEELALNEFLNIDECQYWVFEQGYRSANASIATFSKLCDAAEHSELISTIDCQYWLFERGHLAAKKWSINASEIKQLDITQLTYFDQKYAKLNLH